MDIDDLLRGDDRTSILSDAQEHLETMEDLLIIFTTSDKKFHWLGAGKRTTLLGLIEAAKHELLNEEH